MKIKPQIKAAFEKWSKTHKMSDHFTLEGEVMTGTQAYEKIYGEVPKHTPKNTKAVNIDIQEEEHADMGPPLDLRDPEEY